MENHKVLAVIGARSDSKALPNKNIKPILGKPLLAWITKAAKASKLIDKLIISTDSPEYAETGKQYGAEAPFLRPAEISGDKALDIEYLTHAVKWFENNENWKPDIILRLPATSVMCRTESIDKCIKLLADDNEATSCRTVTEAAKHPYKLWRPEGNQLKPFMPEEITGPDIANQPRQSFPEALSHTDVIAVKYDTLMNQKSLSGNKILFHKIDKLDAIDIDDEKDFLLAEILLKKRLKDS
ncbi:MAG TPA: acylneuraminate cytidylyltransferase family protein [Patescibacteria group bacterium]|nr:acylneuraminate cytidylyltransferase family protein [Patescibacteria group bacterium]